MGKEHGRWHALASVSSGAGISYRRWGMSGFRRAAECRMSATGESARTHGFATGVGDKADTVVARAGSVREVLQQPARAAAVGEGTLGA